MVSGKADAKRDANLVVPEDVTAVYDINYAGNADAPKPHAICSILSGKIRLPEGVAYDTTLLTYSVWCFNTKYSLFTSLRATFTMALLLGIRLHCSV